MTIFLLMLNQLRSLIFGLEEYNKTKLEIRFELVRTFLEKLEIKNLVDFEIIENLSYKIKDQLRVKSSNLNKVINNPAKSLRKKDVLLILDKLDLLKQNFLTSSFSLMREKSAEQSESEEQKQEEVMSVQKEEQEKVTFSSEPKIIEEKKSEINLSNFIIEEDENYKVSLEHGKVPYILITFKKDLDYKIIKKFLILIFDMYMPQGTNVIIEKNIVLIVPRTINDELFILPQNSSIDIEEVFSKLSKNLFKEESTDELKVSEEYLNIFEKKQTQSPSSKFKDKGLDDLLSNEIHKKEHVSHKPESNDEKPQIIMDDKIEIEKKEFEIKDKGIEIIREEKEEIKEKEEKVLTQVPLEKEVKIEEPKQEIIDEKKEEVVQKVISPQTPEVEIENKEFEIYRDDKIVVYLEKNSIAKGEVVIESLLNQNFSDLNESDLTYITLFSKVFSSILFEQVQAHGTNVIYDYNSSKLRIIPRFQDDGMNLDWNPQKMGEATFEGIQKKLIGVMQNEISGKKKSVEKVEGEVMPQLENKSGQEQSLEEKAHYILESLKRIP